jgi:hypothetical protein
MTTTFSTRRSFIRAAGAALSVPLAAAATTVPVHATGEGDPLLARLARLEDVDAIRALNREFARRLNAGARDSLTALFAEPSSVDIHPEVHAVGLEGAGDEDIIEIAPDRQTATALLHCTVHFESAIGPDCPLVEMARQQGGGVLRRTERVVFEHAYGRREGLWKIARVRLRTG